MGRIARVQKGWCCLGLGLPPRLPRVIRISSETYVASNHPSPCEGSVVAGGEWGVGAEGGESEGVDNATGVRVVEWLDALLG